MNIKWKHGDVLRVRDIDGNTDIMHQTLALVYDFSKNFKRTRENLIPHRYGVYIYDVFNSFKRPFTESRFANIDADVLWNKKLLCNPILGLGIPEYSNFHIEKVTRIKIIDEYIVFPDIIEYPYSDFHKYFYGDLQVEELENAYRSYDKYKVYRFNPGAKCYSFYSLSSFQNCSHLSIADSSFNCNLPILISLYNHLTITSSNLTSIKNTFLNPILFFHLLKSTFSEIDPKFKHKVIE